MLLFVMGIILLNEASGIKSAVGKRRGQFKFITFMFVLSVKKIKSKKYEMRRFSEFAFRFFLSLFCKFAACVLFFPCFAVVALDYFFLVSKLYFLFSPCFAFVALYYFLLVL